MRKSINFLEFLACITEVLYAIMADETTVGDCVLSLGDNTSSLGWLRKSNFIQEDEQASHSSLARYYTEIMAKESLCQLTQWFPGKDNGAADLLSREHKLSDTALTHHIAAIYPLQVSPDFRVSPLPPEISSFLVYWVQHRHDTTELPPVLTRKATTIGITTSSSFVAANSTATLTSTDTAHTIGSRFLAPSLTKSDPKRTPRVQRDMTAWLRKHARPPSEVYARPSSHRVDPIHRWTRTEKLRSFYSANSAATETTTLHPNSKKRSHSR
jgi:hypothetical protein